MFSGGDYTINGPFCPYNPSADGHQAGQVFAEGDFVPIYPDEFYTRFAGYTEESTPQLGEDTGDLVWDEGRQEYCPVEEPPPKNTTPSILDVSTDYNVDGRINPFGTMNTGDKISGGYTEIYPGKNILEWADKLAPDLLRVGVEFIAPNGRRCWFRREPNGDVTVWGAGTDGVVTLNRGSPARTGLFSWTADGKLLFDPQPWFIQHRSAAGVVRVDLEDGLYPRHYIYEGGVPASRSGTTVITTSDGTQYTLETRDGQVLLEGRPVQYIKVNNGRLEITYAEAFASYSPLPSDPFNPGRGFSGNIAKFFDDGFTVQAEAPAGAGVAETRGDGDRHGGRDSAPDPDLRRPASSRTVYDPVDGPNPSTPPSSEAQEQPVYVEFNGVRTPLRDGGSFEIPLSSLSEGNVNYNFFGFTGSLGLDEHGELVHTGLADPAQPQSSVSPSTGGNIDGAFEMETFVREEGCSSVRYVRIRMSPFAVDLQFSRGIRFTALKRYLQSHPAEMARVIYEDIQRRIVSDLAYALQSVQKYSEAYAQYKQAGRAATVTANGERIPLRPGETTRLTVTNGAEVDLSFLDAKYHLSDDAWRLDHGNTGDVCMTVFWELLKEKVNELGPFKIIVTRNSNSTTYLIRLSPSRAQVVKSEFKRAYGEALESASNTLKQIKEDIGNYERNLGEERARELRTMLDATIENVTKGTRYAAAAEPARGPVPAEREAVEPRTSGDPADPLSEDRPSTRRRGPGSGRGPNNRSTEVGMDEFFGPQARPTAESAAPVPVTETVSNDVAARVSEANAPAPTFGDATRFGVLFGGLLTLITDAYKALVLGNKRDVNEVESTTLMIGTGAALDSAIGQEITWGSFGRLAQGFIEFLPAFLLTGLSNGRAAQAAGTPEGAGVVEVANIASGAVASGAAVETAAVAATNAARQAVVAEAGGAQVCAVPRAMPRVMMSTPVIGLAYSALYDRGVALGTAGDSYWGDTLALCTSDGTDCTISGWGAEKLHTVVDPVTDAAREHVVTPVSSAINTGVEYASDTLAGWYAYDTNLLGIKEETDSVIDQFEEWYEYDAQLVRSAAGGIRDGVVWTLGKTNDGFQWAGHKVGQGVQGVADAAGSGAAIVTSGTVNMVDAALQAVSDYELAYEVDTDAIEDFFSFSWL